MSDFVVRVDTPSEELLESYKALFNEVSGFLEQLDYDVAQAKEKGVAKLEAIDLEALKQRRAGRYVRDLADIKAEAKESEEGMEEVYSGLIGKTEGRIFEAVNKELRREISDALGGLAQELPVNVEAFDNGAGGFVADPSDPLFSGLKAIFEKHGFALEVWPSLYTGTWFRSDNKFYVLVDQGEGFVSDGDVEHKRADQNGYITGISL